MKLLLIILVVAGALWLRRNSDARTWIASTVRAVAMHVNLVPPDYGTLQQQVLFGARRRRCVAVNGIVRLPAEYRVTFDEHDRGLVEPVEEAFFADITEVLVADAEARQWVVDRPPRFRATYIDHGRPGFPLVTAVRPAARRALAVVPGGECQTRAFDDGVDTEAPAPSTRRSQPVRLRELGTEQVLTVDPLDETVTFGRSPRSDVLVDHPTVSARQAVLSCGPTGWNLVDQGSRNGTFVNDRSAAEPTPIGVGDIVRFGPDITFSVET